jgi:STE24 endopeptidase
MLEIDKERQKKAKEYARLSRRAYFASLALSAVLVVIVLAIDPGRAIEAAVGGSPYLPVAVYFVLLMSVYEVLQLPLSVYTGFVLPHRFELSTQTFKAWLADAAKGGALGLALGLFVVEVLYFLLATQPLYWWLWAAGFMLLFSVVLANLAPVIIFPLFYKFTPLEDEDLVNRLRALAERAGARVRGVYTMDMSRRTRAANAALMGLGNTRRIVLGDTLVDRYPVDEIEVVLAHELGHHAHNDIVKGIVGETAITLLSFWLADQALRLGAGWLRLDGLADPSGLPLLGLVMGAVSFAAAPLTNGFTRWIEADADRYALETTGKPEAFADGMTRLANQNLSDVEPPRWVEVLFYSHPPIGKRLAMAREFALRRGMGSGG